ncbi:MAG: phosphoribosylanthranilate isomerase [Candidatus Freyarchaeota archaeon]|nr:phosphoribosylanthranilate isomerase [Candidatus Jordarchaeia archaeon]MBS7278805.1 phosphoribosylanthranilate isomerase [Candidatus Jordarchaeia archaeon]
MRTVRVKICGITSTIDLQAALDAGADAVGFVVNVPESPRNLSLEAAKELMRITPVFLETVIVTVANSLNHLEKIFEELNPGTLQVHATNQIYQEVRERYPDTRLIGAIGTPQHGSLNTMDAALRAAETLDAVLLDTRLPGKYGGTGKTHDWNLSRRVRDAIYPIPLILAGGLTPENVKQAIKSVEPYAVDVSSGVEASPGVKDREKVYRFVKNAKEVER